MLHEPRRISKREQIRAYIYKLPSTGDEIVEALGIPLQTVSGRLTELKKRGDIQNSGQTRKTRNGADAVVWQKPEPTQTSLFEAER